jgi:NADPH:quinone reductase-like Zn-dependent oxidoreductase
VALEGWWLLGRFRRVGPAASCAGGGLEDRGTLAEYISIRHDAVVLAKPAGLTFEQAASVPVAAFTALQALRDKGQVRPGECPEPHVTAARRAFS